MITNINVSRELLYVESLAAADNFVRKVSHRVTIVEHYAGAGWLARTRAFIP